jgi:hypothetical protein
VKRVLVLALSSFAALAALVSCGRFLESAGSGDASDSGGDDALFDGTVSTADGGTEVSEPFVVVTTDAAPPAKPPACPLADCPNEIVTCKDEDCDDVQRDFVPVGTISVDLDAGTCTLSTDGPPAFSYRTVPRPAPRTYTVLAVKVLDSTPGDRIVATLSIEGAPADGERIVLRRRAGAFELCERNATGTRCTPPLGAFLPQTLHVVGIVTSEDPPNATFALGTGSDECSPLRVIDLTRPFGTGDVRGEVGCIGNGAGCSLRFDDALLLTKAE